MVVEAVGKKTRERNTEREIVMIATGSFVWGTTCRFARARAWRMSSLCVSVSWFSCLGLGAWEGAREGICGVGGRGGGQVNGHG